MCQARCNTIYRNPLSLILPAQTSNKRVTLVATKNRLTSRARLTDVETTLEQRPKRKTGPKDPATREKLVTSVALMRGNGVSKRNIAKELDVSETFVYKVLNSQELIQASQTARGIVGDRLPKAAQNICTSIDKGSVSTSLAVMRGLGVFQPDTQVNVGIVNVPQEWLQDFSQPTETKPDSPSTSTE